MNIKNNEQKKLIKTFKNKEEIERNCKSVIVCQNGFGLLIDIQDLEDKDHKTGFN